MLKSLRPSVAETKANEHLRRTYVRICLFPGFCAHRERMDRDEVGSLLDAAKDGDEREAIYAIKRGANVNAKSRRSGKTPLHLATEKGYKGMAFMLIEEGAMVNAQDGGGQHATTCCCAGSIFEVGTAADRSRGEG
jgi:ankyrin repeat protein